MGDLTRLTQSASGAQPTAGSPFERSPGAILPPRLDLGLTFWSSLYLLIGRNTGALPYFLPLLAVLGLWQGGSRRSVLATVSVAGALLSVLESPFNYYGGPAAVGNRWLLPWFAALWFVPTRPLPRQWLAVMAVLAAPMMIPTWLAPSPDLVTPEGIYRHASGRLHRWLPAETTQRYLPPVGQSVGERFWVRSLSREATVAAASRWRLRGEGPAELQLAAPTALESVYLQFGQQAEPDLEVRGGRLGDMVLLPEGGVGFHVEDLDRRALHPMWWSEDKYHHYVLRLQMPLDQARPQTLSITAFAADIRGGQR